MRNIILAGIFGAIVLFVWNGLSWMVLPWHAKTVHSFTDETVVSKVIKDNIKNNGIYIAQYNKPSMDDLPLVFASVSVDYHKGMQKPLIIYFVIDLVAALLIAYMTYFVKCPKYLSRLKFIILFALTASIICFLPFWNWWHFTINYILVSTADMLISWTLAGILMAAMLGPQKLQHISVEKITINRT
jgi:hypothetical protein